MIPSTSPRRLFLLGGVAIIFGIIASIWPISTVLTLVVVWGFYAIADGVALLVDAARGRTESRGWSIFMGIISLLAGLVAVFHPLSSATSLTWVLGIWLLVRGIMQIMEGFKHAEAGSKWLTVLAGVAYAVAGLIIMANSAAAALSLSVWLGLLAILWGVLLIGAGFALRKSAKTPTA